MASFGNKVPPQKIPFKNKASPQKESMRTLQNNISFFVNLNQTIKIPNLSSPKMNFCFNKTFCIDAQHPQKESALKIRPPSKKSMRKLQNNISVIKIDFKIDSIKIDFSYSKFKLL